MKISIAMKLAGVFTLVCLSLLMLVAVVASVMTTRGIRAEAYKRLDNDVAVTSHTFEYFAQDALLSAQMVASNPRVAHFAAEKGQFDRATVGEILDLLPRKQLVRIYDADGHLLAKSGPDGSSPQSEAGISLALADQPVTGVEPTGNDGLAVRGIAPVHLDGQVVGAVMVGTMLDQAFVDQMKHITGLEVGIAGGNSRNTRWLTHTLPGGSLAFPMGVVSRLRASGQVIKDHASLGGRDYLAAFAPLFGDYGEYVGVLFIGEPQAPLRSLVGRAQMLIFVLVLIGAVIVTAIATLLSRTITDPIRQMVQQATAISAGNLRERLTINSGDELEQLAEAFNRMSEALEVMKIRDQNANPLTKLPGNLVIEEEIERRLALQRPMAVLYADLDNFKAFNDKYGFEQGDRVIQLAAAVIQQAVQVVDHAGDFVGHIGGDDFIVVTHPAVAERIGRELIRMFDSEIPDLYHHEDRERGYIVAHDRRGQTVKFPMCSISVALVTNENRPIRDFLELSSLAAEVKKLAKSKEGSAFARDRRSAAPTEALRMTAILEER